MRPAGNPAGVAEVLEMVPLSGHPGDDILAVWQARARLPAIPIRKIVGNQPAAASGSTSGPVTPMSEVEQFRNFTSGLARQAGWRRNAARIGAVAILLLIVAGLVAGILASG